MSGPRVRRRVVVRGEVQGVFFRHSMRERARRAGLAGWVTNRRDGSVEAVVEGDEAAVLELVDWCRIGPPSARVGDVEVGEEEPEGLEGFEVR